MIYHYVAKVKMDYKDSDAIRTRNYFSFMNRFNAIGIGNDKDGTSHVIFNSDKRLDKERLSKELGGLAVLTLSIYEIPAA